MGTAEFVATILRTPSTYIMLATCILSIQVCWVRWKRRHEKADWQLAALDGRRFGLNWLALGLLVIVGLPVVSIYCFAYWLGPWYLYGP